MDKKTKIILAAVAFAVVAVLVAIVISFQNRQKQLEAEKNAAVLNNQSSANTPTVQGTVLSLVNLAIAAIRAKKAKAGVANANTVTSAEVKSYLSDSGAVPTDNTFDAIPEDTTWNGADTYGG